MDLRPPEDVDTSDALAARPERIAALSRSNGGTATRTARILDVEVFCRDIDFNGERARLTLLIDITAIASGWSARAERIFETSEDLIHVTDSYGKFVQVSPSCEAVLGYRPDEMVGRGANEFILPEDLEATRDADAAGAPRPGDGRRFRCRYHHKDGHPCRSPGSACGRKRTAATTSSAAT